MNKELIKQLDEDKIDLLNNGLKYELNSNESI